MRVEPPYAPPYEVHSPQLPPPRPAPGPRVVALAGFLNRHAGAVWLTGVMLVAGAGLFWLARALFFSDAGLYTMTALVALVALPRLCLALLVIGGFAAIAFMDQSIGPVTRFLAVWWPLVMAGAVALPLALLVDYRLFR